MFKNLLNENWVLKSEKVGEVVAQVPGDITLDLFRGGKIADPYFGMNHKQLDWIRESDFIYECKFDCDKEIFNHDDVLLQFDGIDTFSEIILNGQVLGNTENMFLAYEFNIKDIVKEKDNLLQVKMMSTTKKMAEFNADGFFGVFNVQRLFIRKAQCHFGWDWAPDLPGYGIHGDVILRGENKSRITHISYRASNDGKISLFAELNYNVRPTIDFQGQVISNISEAGKDDVLRYSIAKNPNQPLTETNALVYEHKVKGAKNFANFDMENVQLWWPVGYGEQPLYAFKVELVRDGKVISTKESTCAFREVALEQKPIESEMIGYRFIINGVPVYIKGSNWVPAECFIGDIKDEKYDRLIEIAKEGNFNMLRIWGGGVYEKDKFYETCDKLGVLVWQDLMFACSDLPEDDTRFVENVKKEITYQIKRLRNHPCIIYWCGGNEKTGSYGLQISKGDFFTDVVLRGLVLNLDDTRPFARQSPCSLTDIGNDKTSGESHAGSFETCLEAGMDAYRDCVSSLIVPFVSECAIMGPSTLEALKKTFPEDKLWPMNEYWDDRLMDNPYAAVLMTFAKRQKYYAESMYGECKNVEDFIAKGMTVHAEAMRAECEYARINKGKNWGFMNWMYSDIWPSATWAVVDYFCEPKQVYYQMKKSYAPILLTFAQNHEKNTVLGIVNDTTMALKGEVEYGLKNLAGNVIWKKIANVEVAENGALQVVVEKEFALANTYLYAKAVLNGKEYTNVYSYNMWKTCSFTSDYAYETERKGDVIFVTIKANSFVKGVTLRLPNNFKYDYSDNYFDMQAGEEKVVVISKAKDADINSLVVTDFVKETR